MISQAVIGEGGAAERAARFPVGAAVEFDDLERADRVDVFDRLRASEPISWVPAMGGWLVTSYELARNVLSPRSSFTVEANENLVRASLGPMMLTTDEPGHEPLRAPFEAPFHRRAVQERFAAPVRARVDSLLDQSHRAASANWAPSSPGRTRSVWRATCWASHSTTYRASAGSTRRLPAAWSMTAIPNRSAVPTPRGRSSPSCCWPSCSDARQA